MAPLVVWLLAFLGLSVAARFGLKTSLPRSTRLALALTLLFTTVSHFTMTASLATMLPPEVPEPELIVQASGLFELWLALALVLVPQHRRERALGWLTLGFLLAIFPANVYAAVFGTGPAEQFGVSYLWFRAPLQVFFMAASWYATLSKDAGRALDATSASPRRAVSHSTA